MGDHKKQNLREKIKLKEENCTEKQRFPQQQYLKYTNMKSKAKTMKFQETQQDEQS